MENLKAFPNRHWATSIGKIEIPNMSIIPNSKVANKSHQISTANYLICTLHSKSKNQHYAYLLNIQVIKTSIKFKYLRIG
jgi:hypothetical protein